MTEDDAPLTVDWMVRQYGFDRIEEETPQILTDEPELIKSLNAQPFKKDIL